MQQRNIRQKATKFFIEGSFSFFEEKHKTPIRKD
jgi:hypothetical protein